MSKMGSHCSFRHLKHKLWPKEGSGVKLPVGILTLDPKKSRIDPIYLVVDNVPHIVGMLLMRAKTLPEITPQSEVCSQSYRAPKWRESPLAQFRNSHLGIPGEKNHLDVGSVASHKVYYKGEGGGLPKSRSW
jgi:hypothetical protein